MIEEIFKVSDKVLPASLSDIMLKLMEETGEMATEVNIKNGYVLKPEGKDGILGEGVDAIMCIVHIMRVAYGDAVTPELILSVLHNKLEKWEAHDQKRRDQQWILESSALIR